MQAYAEWMKGLLTFMPDGRYDVKSFATDVERSRSAPGSQTLRLTLLCDVMEAACRSACCRMYKFP